MTTSGRSSGNPKPKPRPRRRPEPPADTAQIRIIAPAWLEEQIRHVLAVAAETMPGWQLAHTSKPLSASGDRVRRYVDVEAHEPPTPAADGRYRYGRTEGEARGG